MMYQTRVTKELLEKIEEVSDVTWQGGMRPTDGFPDPVESLSDLDSVFVNVLDDGTLIGGRHPCASDLIRGTDEEFINRCVLLRPKVNEK